MQPTQVLAALHTGVVPLQFALVRHCTQTLGFGTVLHFGVGALHCASVWHSSTTIIVDAGAVTIDGSRLAAVFNTQTSTWQS